MAESYYDWEIARYIHILGEQTLHDLHLAIFKAFERWEEHLYEFDLGESPENHSQVYFYNGGWDGDPVDDSDGPSSVAIDALDLEVGRCFGSTFDMGDCWEQHHRGHGHQKTIGKTPYLRLGKKSGQFPRSIWRKMRLTMMNNVRIV